MLPLLETALINYAVEYQQLIDSLETLTYEQFQQALQAWMTAGQMLFYFHGNLAKDVCLDIAQSTRDVLKLTPLPVGELTNVCPMKL